MKKILISACLLGTPCRYDGKSSPCPAIEELRKKYDLIPFCPEVEGGLPTPRLKSEIHYDRVINEEKKDVTKHFNLGADKALKACQFFGIDIAILKEASPSCGVHKIHNGRFDGKLVDGEGVTTRLLKKNGIAVYSDEEILDFLASEKEAEEKQAAIKAARQAKKEELRAKKAEEAEEKKEEKKPFFKKSHFHKDGEKSFDKERKPRFHKDGDKPYDKERKPRFHKEGDKPFGEKKKDGFKKDGKKPFGRPQFKEVGGKRFFRSKPKKSFKKKGD